MDEKPGDLLPIEELAAYLKIPKLTLQKLIWKGKLPQKIGGHWRFRKGVVYTWFEETQEKEPGLKGDT